MRTEQGLGAMAPASARQVMHADAPNAGVECNSCHAAHGYDTRAAAVQACLGCHDDEHSRAYLGSPHARLWWAETLGSGAPGSGVSCATCHLPRHENETGGISVQHNQSDNLRPNEKMVRSVCTTCHGTGLSLDALADPLLVRNNFSHAPASHTASLDMVRARVAH
jgi:hypothetical protein